MAKKAAAPVTPIDRWDDEDALAQYRDDAAIASCAVWNMLEHDRWDGGDLARVWQSTKLPLGCYSEDFHAFLWDIVTTAAEYGYRLASINLDAFDRKHRTTADVARALAALIGRPLVEDGQPFPTLDEIAAELGERNERYVA